MNEWEWNLLEDKTATVDHLQIDGIAVRVGDRVRLRPKEGGDIFDIALRGQIAIIESIEEDYEGAQHICAAGAKRTEVTDLHAVQKPDQAGGEAIAEGLVPR